MTFARVPTLAFTIWFFAVGGLHAEPSDDLDRVLQRVRGNVAAQCKHYRDVAESAAGPLEVQRARQGIEIACNCVPHEIDRLVESPGGDQNSQERAESITGEAFQVCGARSFRAGVVTECRVNVAAIPEAEKREEYCQCIEDRVGQLSDRQISDESVRAYLQYEAAVAARLKGETPEPVDSSMISTIQKACLAR